MSDVLDLLKDTPCIAVALREPGDTLIVDNWRLLHGRSRITFDATARVLKRAYLRVLS
jgi:L-asparagine oxygenase